MFAGACPGLKGGLCRQQRQGELWREKPALEVGTPGALPLTSCVGLAGLTASRAPVSTSLRMGSSTPCPTRPLALEFSGILPRLRLPPSSGKKSHRFHQPKRPLLIWSCHWGPPSPFSHTPGNIQLRLAKRASPGRLSAPHLGWLMPTQPLGFCE